MNFKIPVRPSEQNSRAAKKRREEKNRKNESLGEKNNEIVGNKGGIKYRGKGTATYFVKIIIQQLPLL